MATVDYPIDNLGDRPLNAFLLPRLFPALVPHARPARPRYALFGSGSVLGDMPLLPPWAGATPWLVLGTGYQYGRPMSVPPGSRVFAVRGRHTAERMGLDPTLAVADVALLLADHLPRDRAVATNREAVVFKWDHAGPEDRTTFTARTGGDLVGWVRRLWSYERVTTDALHAAILADLYGIPWRPLRWEPKWTDHFGMLGLTTRPRDFVLTDRGQLAEQTERLRRAAAALAVFVDGSAEWRPGLFAESFVR